MTLIELIWTITPAFVLIAIAFPSFKLLYLMDMSYFNIDSTFLTLNLIPINILKSSRTELVLFGNVESTLNISLNKYSQKNTVLPNHL